ncbi:hypothetical protein PHYPSEUDO_001369 [Phytophthora pseudosyringae]|uniref:Uncharacterized protein n=1 Tax=Phytophthora pseudosyringae TaxID=221518 RepID=A0A8T1WGE7_9STRA|nr:hypothetical protein PHYPSEUDO_001369 [Phytophthora pseudosyringae]
MLSVGKSLMSSHPPRSSSSSPTLNFKWHAAGRMNNSESPPTAPVALIAFAIVYREKIAACASANTATAVVSLLFQPKVGRPLRVPDLSRDDAVWDQKRMSLFSPANA